jgi:hypothetical protein
VLSASSGEGQNDKKCDKFVELALLTNNGNIELLESTYNLKPYLLRQTISPFSATANGQIAISHYVCDLSIKEKFASCY